MKPTNPHRPKGLLSGPGGPRRRISQPMILATAFVLTASGGIGVTAASAATPVTPPADTADPVVTATVTITPTAAPAETATDSPTATPATEVPLVGPFLGALHGEVVVPTKDGCGTVTVFTQTGQAVAVADDSITVRSQDGFERSYAIGDSTRTLTARRGGEIRQDAWISVIASVQPGTTAPAPESPAPESPAPLPSTTPTAPETTPTPSDGTPTPPETTPTPSEDTPTPSDGTPAPPAESAPAPLPSDTSTPPAPPAETNSTPPQTEETTPAAPQGETATAAYVFDLSRPSKRLWYLGKSSPYSLKWRSGKPTWRAPEPCPTPTAVPTEPPAATPDPATTPTETAPPTDTAAPSPEPTLTDTPTPTPTS